MQNRAREQLAKMAERLRALPAWAWGVAALIGLGALAFLWDAGTPMTAQEPFSPPDWTVFLSVLLKLGVVLALIYLGLFLLKKWRIDGGVEARRRLSLLETLRLSPKQAVHLVRADGNVLVIGATDQAVSLLTQWPEEASGIESNVGESFAEITARL